MPDRTTLSRRLYVALDDFADGIERFFGVGGRHEAWRSRSGAGDFHIVSTRTTRTLLFGFYGLAAVPGDDGGTREVAVGMPAFQVDLRTDGTAELDSLVFSHEPSGASVAAPQLDDEAVIALVVLLTAMAEDRRAGLLSLQRVWQPAGRP